MSKTLQFLDFDIQRYSRGSDYVKVENLPKTRQDVAIVLSTSIRPTTGLGAGIDELVGTLGVDEISPYLRVPVAFELQNRIEAGLNMLMDAQRRFLFGARSRAELIYEYSPVQVWKSASDPRTYEWKVGVQTYEITSRPFYINSRAR